MIPGEIISCNEYISINKNKNSVGITVVNLGDRPIQVGSHFHFFEVNKSLQFDRTIAFGCHLNIPAGTAVRFEPGETKTITLVNFGGNQHIVGFNNLVNSTINNDNLALANKRLREHDFANKNEAH